MSRKGGNFARDFARMAQHRGLAASTIAKAWKLLNQWEDFLRPRLEARGLKQRYTPGSQHKGESIHDFIAFEKELVRRGLTPGSVSVRLSYVVMYYELLLNEHPDDTYLANLVAKMKAHKRPKQRGKRSPHQPYPVEQLPLILEAAMSIEEVGGNQFSPGGDSDDGLLVATLLYTGLRGGFALGLRVEDVDLERQVIHTKTKGGHDVTIPLHRRLEEFVREHLEGRDERTYRDPAMLFRRGRYPFTWLENGGGGHWRDDDRALAANEKYVADALRTRVEPRVRELFRVDVRPLRAHRIRKSVGTYASQFGLDDTERRVILTHGARTITQEYDVRDVRQVGDLWDLIDFGDADWVAWAVDVGFHVKHRRLAYGESGKEVGGNGEALALLDQLKVYAPPGKEAAWNSFIEGLKGLVG